MPRDARGAYTPRANTIEKLTAPAGALSFLVIYDTLENRPTFGTVEATCADAFHASAVDVANPGSPDVSSESGANAMHLVPAGVHQYSLSPRQSLAFIAPSEVSFRLVDGAAALVISAGAPVISGFSSGFSSGFGPTPPP